MGTATQAKTPQETTGAKLAADQQQEVQGEITGTAPIGARVIRAGEAATLRSADVDSDVFVVVKEDVYREFYPEGCKRPSYQLLFHKGQQVLRSKLEEASGPVVKAAEQNSPQGSAETKDGQKPADEK